MLEFYEKRHPRIKEAIGRQILIVTDHGESSTNSLDSCSESAVHHLVLIVQRIGDLGVQFWQEISNCVIRLIYQWDMKKCEETNFSMFGAALKETRPWQFVSLQFLKLYDLTLHHTSYGTSCQK